jgi:hypothetical protein
MSAPTHGKIDTNAAQADDQLCSPPQGSVGHGDGIERRDEVQLQ